VRGVISPAALARQRKIIYNRTMQNDSNKITIWFIVGFLVVVTAGVIIAGAISGTGSATPSGFTATQAPAITATDWKQGNLTSTVSVIEYGDYECPACAAYQPMVKQLLQDYSSKILFVFRNFPLYNVHPDAAVSAMAAEAAGQQGKFWEMHDLLYTKQTEWATTAPADVVKKFFDGYATSFGLNIAKFEKDMNSSSTATKITNDVAGGNAAQIDHTPTYFINLKQIPNPQSYDEFKAAVDQALANATSS
jgi:protein-disulfide isomerase